MHTLSLAKVKSLLGVGAVVALALSLSPPAGAKPPLIPRCYELDGTACPMAGNTAACTDVCGNNLSCTCTYNYYNPWNYDPYWDPSVPRWDCDYEC